MNINKQAFSELIGTWILQTGKGLYVEGTGGRFRTAHGPCGHLR